MEAASDHTCMPTLPQYCTSHSQRPPFPLGSGCLPLSVAVLCISPYIISGPHPILIALCFHPFLQCLWGYHNTPTLDLTAPGSSPGLTCRQEDTSHTALAEAQLLNNVVKMGWEEGETHLTPLAVCLAPPHPKPHFLALLLGTLLLDRLDSPTPKKSGQVNTAGPRPVHGASMGSIQARNTSSSVKGAMTWFRSQRMSVRQQTQERGARVNIQDKE